MYNYIQFGPYQKPCSYVFCHIYCIELIQTSNRIGIETLNVATMQWYGKPVSGVFIVLLMLSYIIPGWDRKDGSLGVHDYAMT